MPPRLLLAAAAATGPVSSEIAINRPLMSRLQTNTTPKTILSRFIFPLIFHVTVTVSLSFIAFFELYDCTRTVRMYLCIVCVSFVLFVSAHLGRSQRGKEKRRGKRRVKRSQLTFRQLETLPDLFIYLLK